MAKTSKNAKQTSANIGFEKQIWDAACVLWGHIPAADYRKVIVGLIFLRYIGNAFEKRYNELLKEGDGFENDPDAYEEENIFFVPEKARWPKIAAATFLPENGKRTRHFSLALLLYVVVCVGGWGVLALLESWVTSAFS